MDWIFDHFQLVLGIIIVAGYLLRGILGARAVGGNEAEDQRRPAADETAEQERTRQIQEEIRRRILARQRGETPAKTSQSATVRMDPVPQQRTTPPPIVRRSTVMAVDPLADAASQAILERQRQLNEKMRQLKQLRQSREAGSGGMPDSPSRSWAQKAERKRAPVAVLGNLKDELHRSGSLRRAIILREVLGQPLGFEVGPPNLPRR